VYICRFRLSACYDHLTHAFESSEIMSSLDITANRYMQTGHTGHTDTQEHTHTYNIHNIHHSSPIFNQLSPYLFHKFQSQITVEIWISKVSDNNHLKYIRKKSEEKPKEKKSHSISMQCNATKMRNVGWRAVREKMHIYTRWTEAEGRGE
jgi:hypothetical protein